MPFHVITHDAPWMELDRFCQSKVSFFIHGIVRVDLYKGFINFDMVILNKRPKDKVLDLEA